MTSPASRRSWPDFAAVWRWHFYAGLLCVPVILWLAVTGTIYLFKPQVEGWLDAPYDQLAVTGAPTSADAQVKAAVAAVPGGRLRAYELPGADDTAVRVLVGKGDDVFRVYLHPETLATLKVVKESDRFMNQISTLHGQLALGDRGSMVVEIAACWAIVMILTGLFLWWPRNATSLAGVLFPRFGAGKRLFWRDLHAVTGVWVSALALFLLLSGLPWAKYWGDYLKEVRVITGTAEGVQDWTNGKPQSLRDGVTATDEHADHMHTMGMPDGTTHVMAPQAPLDALVVTARAQNLAPPVLLQPPRSMGAPWIAKSDAGNRPQRATVELDASSGALLGRRDFNQRHPIDQAIGVGIAAHEGRLFGWINQLVSLTAALGLITLSGSALMLWLRRRPVGALGAPEQVASPRSAPALLAIVALLAVLFPLFGASLATVWLTERLLLRRIPSVRTWLGLTPARAAR